MYSTLCRKSRIFCEFSVLFIRHAASFELSFFTAITTSKGPTVATLRELIADLKCSFCTWFPHVHDHACVVASHACNRDHLYDGRVFIRSWCWDPDFRDRHLRKKIWKFSSPGRKTKVSCGYPENQEKLAFGYPVLRSKPQRWIPELRFGYPPLRKISKIFLGKTRNFSRKFRGVSAPALDKNPAVTLSHVIQECSFHLSSASESCRGVFFFTTCKGTTATKASLILAHSSYASQTCVAGGGA